MIACTGVLPNECAEDDSNGGNFMAGAVPGCVCDSSVGFHRFSFNDYSPSSLEGTLCMHIYFLDRVEKGRGEDLFVKRATMKYWAGLRFLVVCFEKSVVTHSKVNDGVKNRL